MSLMSLWLPVLVAAVLVFIASSVIHMVLRYHDNDFETLPKQDDVGAALRPFAIPPGSYMLPKPASREAMNSPEYQEKLKQGPVVAMTVFPNRPFNMGASLAQWFVYCVVVGVVAGYVAGRTLDAGTEYLQVFRVSGTVAFAGYGLALAQGSIWFGRKWSVTLKSMLDALIYGLLTGGAFGWLWPAA